ncbi:uncharacterized protein LOC126673734 [Mercurialis annua]|uniref:uncharacterized protein LOC126673734 n=1 Tax=Mercurialis annua TaxID=3986 RepID=UPI00215E1B66|nr:uncharacterized protein LOC126673734 [Mercurialis annua]
MGNPRRSSNEISNNPFHQPQTISILHFLKKPHAIPILLSIFIFLTCLSLTLHHHSSSFNVHATTQHPNQNNDKLANLIRFSSNSASPISKDNRGWLLNPLSLALHSGITGGPVSCASIHVGEIKPGTFRGNHRHYSCNETFVIWGAKTLFRVENSQIVDKGYAEVTIGADEVAVAASPRGTAHLLVNVDPFLTTFFIGCQDSLIIYNDSTTDFNVWKDF